MAKTLYEFKNKVFFVFSIFFSQPYTQKKDIWYFEYRNKIYVTKPYIFLGFKNSAQFFMILFFSSVALSLRTVKIS